MTRRAFLANLGGMFKPRILNNAVYPVNRGLSTSSAAKSDDAKTPHVAKLGLFALEQKVVRTVSKSPIQTTFFPGSNDDKIIDIDTNGPYIMTLSSGVGHITVLRIFEKEGMRKIYQNESINYRRFINGHIAEIDEDGHVGYYQGVPDIIFYDPKMALIEKNKRDFKFLNNGFSVILEKIFNKTADKHALLDVIDNFKKIMWGKSEGRGERRPYPHCRDFFPDPIPFRYQFLSDASFIAISTYDRQAIAWTIKSSHLNSDRHIFKGHTGDIRCLTEGPFKSPNSRTLITGAMDATLRRWDINGCFATLEGHTGPVTSVAVSPINGDIVSSSMDQSIIIWDSKTNEWKHKIPTPGIVTAVAVDPDGTIYSGLANGTFQIHRSIPQLQASAVVKVDDPCNLGQSRFAP